METSPSLLAVSLALAAIAAIVAAVAGVLGAAGGFVVAVLTSDDWTGIRRALVVILPSLNLGLLLLLRKRQTEIKQDVRDHGENAAERAQEAADRARAVNGKLQELLDEIPNGENRHLH